ncbi:ATP-grasp domain-containing protein [Chromobacterium phragmitis]|uniref:ATP-grasp domain-containing protein n=1 Tax=Chromobacterium phragmitis TaxID=2202141 RepID=A0ABV0IWF8_9NEIS
MDEVYDPHSKTLCLDLEQAIGVLAPLVSGDAAVKIFCNQEANMEVADRLRERFGLHDHLAGKVEHFRDKLAMKHIIQSAGLRAPVYAELMPDIGAEAYADLRQALRGKFIVKPRASVGSRGVYKIDKPADFERFLSEAAGDDCEYEAEEFIDGDLYEFDLAIQNGEPIYSAVSRYSCPMADLQEGRTLGSIMVGRNEPLHARIVAFGLQCARALGADNGCFHMELFHSVADELVFLEVAARSPGLMTVPAYHSWEGVNLYDMELMIQSGQDASRLGQAAVSHQSRPAFFVVFPKVGGTIRELGKPELDCDIDMDWRVHVGQRVEATTTNIDFAGKAFVRADSEAEVRQAFQHLVGEFIPVSYL